MHPHPDEHHVWLGALLLMVVTIIAALPHMDMRRDLDAFHGLSHAVRNSASGAAYIAPSIPLGVM